MTLNIALNRGRVLEACLPMLEAAGINPPADMDNSRKLIFDVPDADVRLIVMRGSDVPTYVEYGAADVGITGKDTILEYTTNSNMTAPGFYERLDLGVARCRIMTAAPVGVTLDGPRVRVATKFVNIARRFFGERGQQVSVIPLSGAMEIAPLVDLADGIVDIVDTGNTLAANGLEPLDTIVEVSTRVIVNRASMKTKFDRVQSFLSRLETVVA